MAPGPFEKSGGMRLNPCATSVTNSATLLSAVFHRWRYGCDTIPCASTMGWFGDTIILGVGRTHIAGLSIGYVDGTMSSTGMS